MFSSRVPNCLAESTWCHLPMHCLRGWSLFFREERMCVSPHFYSSGIILSYRIQRGLPSTHSLFLGSNKGWVWVKVSHILKWRHLVMVQIGAGSRFNRPGETRHHLGPFSARLLWTQSWQRFSYCWTSQQWFPECEFHEQVQLKLKEVWKYKEDQKS